MSELRNQLESLETSQDTEKIIIVDEIEDQLQTAGYKIVERNDQKPWGAYLRIDSAQADPFVEEFFSGLTPEEARLGIENAELSPKILLVAPAQRLSWQYHDRRAERWVFLTAGAYNKSKTDEPGELFEAQTGEVIQFEEGERHRLVGLGNDYTVVAEIWQHTDADNPSNEDDIVRLQDDYRR